ncbi:hypothetical protein GCM10027046_35460 [Uliginosibacterium flavum]
MLAKLNAVRARHGLPQVTYDASDDGAAAEAALYMAANKALTHTPDSSGKCYSANAARLAGSSNLHMSWGSGSTLGTPSSDAIVGYLIDNNVPSLGHRRWVLNPYLGKTTYGRVDGQPDGSGGSYYMASTLKASNGVSSVSMSNDFVAYPYGTYPSNEFSTSWFLSFSALPSKTNVWANGSSQVSYASATIAVTHSGGSLSVSQQSADYVGYGLPNNLQWKVAGLVANTDYTVTISNVTVNGATRQYQYPFRLQ